MGEGGINLRQLKISGISSLKYLGIYKNYLVMKQDYLNFFKEDDYRGFPLESPKH